MKLPLPLAVVLALLANLVPGGRVPAGRRVAPPPRRAR